MHDFVAEDKAVTNVLAGASDDLRFLGIGTVGTENVLCRDPGHNLLDPQGRGGFSKTRHTQLEQRPSWLEVALVHCAEHFVHCGDGGRVTSLEKEILVLLSLGQLELTCERPDTSSDERTRQGREEVPASLDSDSGVGEGG